MADTIRVTYILRDGSKKDVEADIGDNVLELAHKHDIDLEDEEYFDRIPEATEEEEDMLDLAFGLEETSRLGCQIELTQELDGLTVKLPQATRNFYVDGHVPKPH